ncbi:MAG: hypothetical protein PW843_24305 [Azospirillaceae bacterium]|nr:hypothetical protein [Azospirillaceae bacterium]
MTATTSRDHPLIDALRGLCEEHDLPSAVLLVPNPQAGTMRMVAVGPAPHGAAIEGLGTDLLQAIADGQFDSAALAVLQGGAVQ